MTDTQTSEWIEHDGKGMPVDGDAEVIVRFPDGITGAQIPAQYWHHKIAQSSSWVWPNGEPTTSRISAYRVVKP